MRSSMKVSKPATARQSQILGRKSKAALVVPDTENAESWNDVRGIGSQDAYQRLIDPTHDSKIGTLKDAKEHDWDFYIRQFNEQYKIKLKKAKLDRQTDSVSTIAETLSELMLKRKRRLTLYRKLLMATCILLWCAWFYVDHIFYLTYEVYPSGLLDFEDNDIFNGLFIPRKQLAVSLMCLPIFLVASFGFMCATCFRSNWRPLRQFILRGPYVLFCPMIMIFAGVKFTGHLTTERLEKTFRHALIGFHDKKDPKRNDYVRDWNLLQSILACCGIENKADWQTVDNDLTDDITFIPESCCPKKFYQNNHKGEAPPKDDCFYIINPQKNTDEYEWAYPEGCVKKALKFYVEIGAGCVGIMFVIFLFMVLCFVFAKQYYTVLRKTNEVRFKYHYKTWIQDIIFWNALMHLKFLICTRCFGDVECCRRFQYAEEDDAALRRKRKYLQNAEAATAAAAEKEAAEGGRQGRMSTASDDPDSYYDEDDGNSDGRSSVSDTSVNTLMHPTDYQSSNSTLGTNSDNQIKKSRKNK